MLARHNTKTSASCYACSFVILIFCCCLAWAQGPTSVTALLDDAAAKIASGDLQRAESELQEILQASPGDYQAMNLMGVVRAQQGRTAEAEKLFTDVIKVKPFFAGARLNLGLLYEQLHRDDDAIAQLQEAARLEPSRPEALAALLNAYRAQARSAAQAGQLEKGLALLLRARKAAPKDPDVLFDFGMIALRMSLFPDAIEALQEELVVRPDDPDGLYALGRAQIAFTKYAEARSTFEQLVRLRPEDPGIRYGFGLVLQALQQDKDARAQFEQSIALQPLQTEAYFQLGLLDLEEKDLEHASERFNHVLQRNPKHAGALVGMGRVEFEKKQYEDAVKFLAQASENDPSLRQAHYYLGLTYARLGRKEDSDKELQTASRLEHEEVEKHQRVLKLLNPDDENGKSEESKH